VTKISDYIFFTFVFLSQNSPDNLLFCSNIYILKGTPLLGARRTSGFDIYSFIFSNTSCYSALQINSDSSFSFNMGVKGIIFPDKLAMNLLK
jgi:hypothetical protein